MPPKSIFKYAVSVMFAVMPAQIYAYNPDIHAQAVHEEPHASGSVHENYVHEQTHHSTNPFHEEAHRSSLHENEAHKASLSDKFFGKVEHLDSKIQKHSQNKVHNFEHKGSSKYQYKKKKLQFKQQKFHAEQQHKQTTHSPYEHKSSALQPHQMTTKMHSLELEHKSKVLEFKARQIELEHKRIQLKTQELHARQQHLAQQHSASAHPSSQHPTSSLHGSMLHPSVIHEPTHSQSQHSPSVHQPQHFTINEPHPGSSHEVVDKHGNHIEIKINNQREQADHKKKSSHDEKQVQHAASAKAPHVEEAVKKKTKLTTTNKVVIGTSVAGLGLMGLQMYMSKRKADKQAAMNETEKVDNKTEEIDPLDQVYKGMEDPSADPMAVPSPKAQNGKGKGKIPVSTTPTDEDIQKANDDFEKQRKVLEGSMGSPSSSSSSQALDPSILAGTGMSPQVTAALDSIKLASDGTSGTSGDSSSPQVSEVQAAAAAAAASSLGGEGEQEKPKKKKKKSKKKKNKKSKTDNGSGGIGGIDANTDLSAMSTEDLMKAAGMVDVDSP